MKTIASIKKELVEIGKRLYNRGFVAANDGNLSVRVDKERILITPTGVSKGFMEPEMMVLCDLQGRSLSHGPKASTEILLHLKVYEQREEIHGIVHAHPPYATAFGVAGIPLTQATLPEVIMTLGGIPLIEYGTPGTEAIVRPLEKHVKEYDAFLLQNHGALTAGKDLLAAYFRMETLEHCAQITFISKLLGKIQTLPGSEVDKLLQQRRKIGLSGDFSPAVCPESLSGACAILKPGETVIETSRNDSAAGADFRAEKDPNLRDIVRKIVEGLIGRGE
jgi:L-fuculose-phosphate aldolase